MEGFAEAKLSILRARKKARLVRNIGRCSWEALRLEGFAKGNLPVVGFAEAKPSVLRERKKARLGDSLGKLYLGSFAFVESFAGAKLSILRARKRQGSHGKQVRLGGIRGRLC